MEIRNSFRSEQFCFKSIYPGFWILLHPFGRARARSPEHCLPGGAPSWVGCVLWGPPRSQKGRKPSGEGTETSRETGARIPSGEHCFSPVAEWGRRERAGKPNNEGGRRRGEEAENKRIRASTLPSSLSCFLSSSWSSSHPYG